MSETAVRQAFEAQAKACDDLGSPFTARLCRAAAARLERDSAVGRRILDWPGDATSRGDSVPLRLAGAMHSLVIAGKIAPLTAIAATDEAGLWAACEAAFENHGAAVLEWLQSAPQTNEVRRSAALLPGFLTIARLFAKPLVLSEIGASAGLNLQFDRYCYTLGGLQWGESSAVHLAPDWDGPAAPLEAELEIAARAGCDLNPLDASLEADRLRLKSYIWADQTDRLERSEQALRIAAATGLRVEKADAVDWLRQRFATVFDGAAHVVYHSIAWQYLPDDAKRRGEALIAAAGARASREAPLARLQMEADDRPEGAALTLQIWPDGERREIGRADFHGRWVKWNGWDRL